MGMLFVNGLTPTVGMSRTKFFSYLNSSDCMPARLVGEHKWGLKGSRSLQAVRLNTHAIIALVARKTQRFTSSDYENVVFEILDLFRLFVQFVAMQKFSYVLDFLTGLLRQSFINECFCSISLKDNDFNLEKRRTQFRIKDQICLICLKLDNVSFVSKDHANLDIKTNFEIKTVSCGKRKRSVKNAEKLCYKNKGLLECFEYKQFISVPQLQKILLDPKIFKRISIENYFN
ncbi:hypothetical protein BpHYR1_031422 [Brachionus plicatilis]|uniref:Uncharacterized protein n=1 Tax=Brachionus plicatilis TaxID=10195 RepID=A0A3M7SW71_BRAPC|nr:hypothetical protein BpHYR1_031422 [Brachionus plicatilis]